MVDIKKINWLLIFKKILKEGSSDEFLFFENKKYIFKYVGFLKNTKISLWIWEEASKRAASFSNVKIHEGIKIIDSENTEIFHCEVPNDLSFDRL